MWRWALAYLKPYGHRIAALALLSLLEIGLRVLLPWPMKTIVDQALGSQPPSAWLMRLPGVSPGDRVSLLIAIAVAGILIQFMHQALLMTHTRLFTVTGHQLTRDLRQHLFSHLQGLALRHHSRLPVGEAVHRLEADAGALEHFMLRGVFPMIFSALTLIVMFGILARIEWSLALVAMGVVPFMFVWIRWGAKRLRPGAEQTRRLESRLTARLHESFAAIRLIKSFAREPYETSRFSGDAEAAMRARIVLTTREALFSLVVGTLTVIGSTLVVIVGGLLVLRGRLTLGTLLVALAYLGFVYGPLSGIANTAGAMQQALAGLARVRATFAIAAEPMDAGHRAVSRLRGRVSFEHVHFSYEGHEVLHDVTFTAEAGSLIALVGPSGAGKTTLVSLIPRFYEATLGRVLVDGIDVTAIRLADLRRQVAIVQQDSVLMSGSVGANILYGRLDASLADVEQAARDADAASFIGEMERGYATELGAAGTTLSGGQRQRLSIARAFLKDAPILILDEPTASLDPISARAVGTALARLRQGRTTFVIAHHLATVKDADRILVMERGRIVASGVHDALLESSALYRTLARGLHGESPEQA